MKKAICIAAVFFLVACAGRMIQFEQYSMAMSQKVSAESSIYLGSDETFQGVIWLNPILKEENVKTESVKLIENYGIYYLCADDFKNVWIIQPGDDGMTGSFKAIDVTPDDETDTMKGISFSRYGSKENTCVKFRFNGNEIFIDRKGKLNEKCN
ncbi:MAG: hypothetical protein JW956_01035 [Calditrichaceae bacterium]|nr:hypothetical protein [Calditrichaceae bacterium]